MNPAMAIKQITAGKALPTDATSELAHIVVYETEKGKQ